MKKNKLILFLLLITSCLAERVAAQNAATNSGGQVQTVQPKIMVIPYTKENEDIRTVLEFDVNKRIAITKIKEAFGSRGFTTVDFEAKLKSAKDNNAFTSDNQTDIKTQIIQMSGADIYVNVELIIGLQGTSVGFNLNAYETSTGNDLNCARTIDKCTSGKWNYSDIGKFSAKAIEACSEDFLNAMQLKFTDIVNNGKSVAIDISFNAGSQYKMSSEIGSDGLPLSDQLEMWMEKNAFKNNYHIQGTSDLKMIFDDVKIPLKDQASGNNYNPNKFALELWKFIKELGLQPGKDVKGNTIYITIK
jgi:hypothetical protein